MAAIFAAQLSVDRPGVGVTFLYIVPTVLASLWLGRRCGVLVGAASAGLFLLGLPVNPYPEPALATALRLAMFCGVAYLVGALVEQRTQLGDAVDSSERELAELRAIQDALTPPELPSRPALELASCYVPAQEGVAGDFYMVAEGPRDSTVVVVGDVAGKGVEAAQRATFVRTALVTFAPFTDNPCRLLEMANSSLIEKVGPSETFVTASCVSFRPGEGVISWALAGHPPPMRLDDGTPLNGVAPGAPLGIAADVGCNPSTAGLKPGAGLVMYTDGLSEARDRRSSTERDPPAPRLFGGAGIAATLERLPGAAPGTIVAELKQRAEQFSGGSLADDLCIVALRATA